jgi:UDP-3-O-[3-hydroxymyristoyl] glucosamine N-acyltransferase
VKVAVRDLAALVGGRVVGDDATVVAGVAGIDRAGASDVTFVAGDKWLPLLKGLRAAAVIVQSPADDCPSTQIVVKDANLAFAKIAAEMERRRAAAEAPHMAGTSPRAFVDPTAKVDPTASIAPMATIDAGAEIGARAKIGAGAYVGRKARVGDDAVVHPNASILEGVRIGARCVIHAGAVLGADGFGFATDEKGEHHKVPQLGTVVVEDDVEIGANTCVDRARFAETRIGSGSKIDNLVQIGHNVELGPRCLLVAHSGVAGSSKLGRNVVVGAMAGVTGHVTLGDFAQVAAMSGVSKDLDGAQGYLGVPAKPYREGLKIRTLTQRLPELFERLKALEAEIETLKGGASDGGGAA